MDPPTNSFRPQLLKAKALPVVFAFLGLLMAFYPTIFSGFDKMQQDPGDTRLYNFVLEHEYRWLRGEAGAEGLWSPGIFYPDRNTLTYSDLFVSFLPFYVPWRALGAQPDTAFQLWMLTVAALNFITAYLFARICLNRGIVAASFAAFLFAFGSARLNQLGHQQLLSHFYILISLFGLAQLMAPEGTYPVRKFVAALILFFGGISAQFYGGYYYGWFFIFTLTLLVPWIAFNSQRRQRAWAFLRLHWMGLLVGAGLFALSLVPMATHYLSTAKRIGFRSYTEAVGMLPRFESWFYVGPENWLWGWTIRVRAFRLLPMEWEHRLGLGLFTTIILIYALWRTRRQALSQALGFLSIAVILLASVYRGHFSPWAVIFHWVPGASAIRAISRIGIFLLFPAAYALSLFIEQAQKHRFRLALLSVGVLALVEQGRTPLFFEKIPFRRKVESLATLIDPTQCSAFFYSPRNLDTRVDYLHLDAIGAYLATGVPTLNGYSGNAPPGWRLEEARILTPTDETRLAADLSNWETRSGLNPEAVCWIRP